jgi:hypothetical protein
MKLPKFNAEASLGPAIKNRFKRNTIAARIAKREAVLMQASESLSASDYGRAFSLRKVPIMTRRALGYTSWCIATAEGGLWCCVEGKDRPVCWEVPPPSVIYT